MPCLWGFVDARQALYQWVALPCLEIPFFFFSWPEFLQKGYFNWWTEKHAVLVKEPWKHSITWDQRIATFSLWKRGVLCLCVSPALCEQFISKKIMLKGQDAVTPGSIKWVMNSISSGHSFFSGKDGMVMWPNMLALLWTIKWIHCSYCASGCFCQSEFCYLFLQWTFAIMYFSS